MSLAPQDAKADEFFDEYFSWEGFHDGPILKAASEAVNYTRIANPRHRDGIGIKSEDATRCAAQFSLAVYTEAGFVSITEQLQSQYNAALQLWTNYKTQLDAFRGQVKNDSASLDAQARRMTDAAYKMNAAFASVIGTLTSVEMREAIENAERLASALNALNALKSHKLMFATVDAAPND